MDLIAEEVAGKVQRLLDVWHLALEIIGGDLKNLNANRLQKNLK